MTFLNHLAVCLHKKNEDLANKYAPPDNHMYINMYNNPQNRPSSSKLLISMIEGYAAKYVHYNDVFFTSPLTLISALAMLPGTAAIAVLNPHALFCSLKEADPKRAAERYIGDKKGTVP
jgi:hypothetical protein